MKHELRLKAERLAARLEKKKQSEANFEAALDYFRETREADYNYRRHTGQVSVFPTPDISKHVLAKCNGRVSRHGRDANLDAAADQRMDEAWRLAVVRGGAAPPPAGEITTLPMTGKAVARMLHWPRAIERFRMEEQAEIARKLLDQSDGNGRIDLVRTSASAADVRDEPLGAATARPASAKARAARAAA